MADKLPVVEWSFLCPYCDNKTLTVETDSDPVYDAYVDDPDGDYDKLHRQLRIRAISCDNCKRLLALGTYTYYHKQFGFTKGNIGQLHAEYFAFQVPGLELSLPPSTPKNVSKALKEAEFALDNNKLLSAGAMIRTAIDRLLTAEKIKCSNFEEGIAKLKVDDELKSDMAKLNILGKETLHLEEYAPGEIRNALKIMVEALDDIYGKRQRRADLHKAISDKASNRGKNNINKKDETGPDK